MNNQSNNDKIEIGEIAPAGHPNEGFIYAGIASDQRPLWVSQFAPSVMNYFEAAAWARSKDGYLPTQEQGEHIANLRGKGALKGLFNRDSDDLEGWIWLADFRPDIYPSVNMYAMAADDGYQVSYEWKAPLSAVCIRR